MKIIKVSAPGKVHLLGEHAIVYGKPGIIAAIDKRCYVTLTSNKKSSIKIFSQQLNKTLDIDLNQVAKIQSDSQNKWEQYIKNNDIDILKSITTNELDFVVIAIGETLKFLNKKPTFGFDLEINSEIPIGIGIGSSAAVSVSTIGAVFLHLGIELDKERINEIAYLAEQKRHGLPSGGDNSTVTYGSLVWFRKESSDLKIIQPIPFTISEKLAKNFVLIDTGRPKETTGEMILMVKKLSSKRPKWTEKIFNDQEKLVKRLLSALKEDNEWFVMETIRLGERNLEKIGVVSKFSHDLIRQVEGLGGVAKICGAGGAKDKTGIILTYHSDIKQIMNIAKANNLNYFQTSLGVDGIRNESTS